MGMFIRKENKKKVYQYLFMKGVMVCKKDVHMARNPDIPIPNLEVLKTMESLVSRKFVTEEFNWQYHYYFLTEAGIVFLRDYLNIPETVVPETVAKASVSARAAPASDGAQIRRNFSEKSTQSGPYQPRFVSRPWFLTALEQPP